MCMYAGDAGNAPGIGKKRLCCLVRAAISDRIASRHSSTRAMAASTSSVVESSWRRFLESRAASLSART